jgi:hypothetical protein
MNHQGRKLSPFADRIEERTEYSSAKRGASEGGCATGIRTVSQRKLWLRDADRRSDHLSPITLPL